MPYKLVRDNIPQVIRDRGGAPVVRRATRLEFWGLLRAKLLEEAKEFLDSEQPEELADILEVVYALAEGLSITAEELDQLRQAKRERLGGFATQTVWLGNL